MPTATTPLDEEALVRSLERRAHDTLERPDAHDRAIRLHQLLTEVDQLKKQIAEGRALAVYEANTTGVSLQRLAEDFGVSKTLIQQLVAQGKRIAEDRHRKR